ncbi:MAG: hypothetical protein M5R36_06205 [Deltaproteobacteria bacterium]|nr:hypothetical protein [Deltaproteobacteria bacterium]
MKKTALATVILMLAFSFAWAADPGDWTYGSGNPSLISFAMLDVASLGAADLCRRRHLSGRDDRSGVEIDERRTESL